MNNDLIGSSGPYSSYKAAYHLDSLTKLRNGEHPVPKQVQLIISDYCQESCNFCSYRHDGVSQDLFAERDTEGHITNINPKLFIPYKNVIEILDDCVETGVKAIQLTGGGDPSAHPQFRNILQDIIDRKLDLALVTHGAVIKEGVPDLLAKGNWVRISIDCATKETYSKVRSVPEHWYDRVLTNVERIVTARNNLQNSKLHIGIGFVVTKDNWWEVIDAVKTAHDLGVDNIRISAVFQNNYFNYFKDFYDDAAGAVKTAVKLYNNDKFKVFNLFGDRIDELKQHSPTFQFCSYMHFNTYIAPSRVPNCWADVYKCCVTSYSQNGLIGSLNDNLSFKQYLESSSKKLVLDQHDSRKCPACMFSKKIEFTNSLLDPEPVDINFV